MGTKVTWEEESLARNTTPTPFPLPTRPIIQQHCILFNIKNINFNKLLRCKEHSTHTNVNDKEPQYFIYRTSTPKPHNHLQTWQKNKSKVAQNLYQHKTYADYFSFWFKYVNVITEDSALTLRKAQSLFFLTRNVPPERKSRNVYVQSERQ